MSDKLSKNKGIETFFWTKEMDLHKFAPCKYVAKCKHSLGVNNYGVKVVNATLAYPKTEGVEN